jgi:hypothetical protein
MSTPILTAAAFQHAAIAWVETLEQQALATGQALDDRELALADHVGVRYPERIRILELDAFPQPPEPELHAAARAVGLLGPDTVGLTTGYGILLRWGSRADARVFSHECRHVSQYESAGSAAAFLKEYIGQVLQFGYRNSPLEQDARAHERLAFLSS